MSMMWILVRLWAQGLQSIFVFARMAKARIKDTIAGLDVQLFCSSPCKAQELQYRDSNWPELERR
jgi:hypothetical protein